jgi:diacylglycerol kinase family enzyme
MNQVVSGIAGFFKTAGSKDYTVHVSRFPRDAVSLVRAFAGSLRGEAPVRVYAVGGDGILFDCLNGVMGLGNVELAAVPYGRTNNFVRGFGRQNLALFRDIALQVSAPAIPLDVMYTGSLFALNFCVAGTESEALQIAQNIREYMGGGSFMSRWIKGRFYDHIYYLGAVPAIFGRKELRQRYTITLDGEDLSGDYRGIKISNGCWYGSGRCPLRAARPDDGMLDILFANAAGPFRTFSLLPFYVKGRYYQFPADFMMKRGRKLSIRSESPLILNFDGITHFDTGLTIELLPGAVKFADPSRQGYQGALSHEKRR